MSTIREIANRAGVSCATVSRALHGIESISIGTRKKILKIAEELKYFPNQAAQSLVDRKSGIRHQSNLISIVYQSGIALNDYYFSRVISSIVEEASQEGFATSIASLSNHYQSILSFNKQLKDRFATGLLLVGDLDDAMVSMMQAYCPNCVVVDKPISRISCVFNDNERGAHEAVSYLLASGCRRIGLIHGKLGQYFTEPIRRGYRKALEDRGIELDETLCLEGDFHVAGGHSAMQQLLRSESIPDAVFSNDEMAVGALRAIKEAGLRVPGDISLMGFDDLSIAGLVDPPLSTVRVDYEFMARTAVRRIVENVRGEQVIPVNIIIPTKLVIRASTRPSAGKEAV